jgi:hypothetical protein
VRWLAVKMNGVFAFCFLSWRKVECQLVEGMVAIVGQEREIQFHLLCIRSRGGNAAAIECS